jgi:hypothetical protein
LTTIARRGDRVLRSLTHSERDALARGYLRFRVDREVVVTVAAPRGAEPYWFADQGFEPTDLRLVGPSGPWSVYRRTFATGWVGLGVNGLDRTAADHYVVFLQSANGAPVGPPAIVGGHWHVLAAETGVSLASGVDLPIRSLDPSLSGATLLQPAHDERHSTVLASGRVWKTHSVAARVPDQITVAFGADAARALVWSWRTGPETPGSVVRYYPLPPGSTQQPDAPTGRSPRSRGLTGRSRCPSC